MLRFGAMSGGRDCCRNNSRAQKPEVVSRPASGMAHDINTPIRYGENKIKFIENAYRGRVLR